MTTKPDLPSAPGSSASDPSTSQPSTSDPSTSGPSTSGPSTSGLAVFVVEDEALVAMNLEDMLFELGCTIVGPAMRIERAEKMLEEGMEADVAILDVNVAGQMIFPFARRLAEHGMPIVFATGYGRSGLPEDFHDMPILQKPYTLDDVEVGLRSAVRGKVA